jgi:hypothetical protein
LFHVLAPEEIDFTFDRPARFVDPEGGEPMLIDPSLVASRYRQAVGAWLAALDRLVKDNGIDYRRVLLGDDPAAVLADFLLARLQRRTR